MKKLKKLIKAKYGYLYKYAEKLGISRVALSYKMGGRIDFSLKEIKVIKKDFGLTDSEIVKMFMN